MAIGSYSTWEEDLAAESWPSPLSEKDVAIRQRSARLLEALRRILLAQSDRKVWENEHDLTFALLRRGCLDGADNGLLEAPIYSNTQIETAWIFIFEVRKNNFNRRRQIQECAQVLGASYNWSMVLFGSQKVREALRNLPNDICLEILEDANAMDLLESLGPRRSSLPGQQDFATDDVFAQEAMWQQQRGSATNGWGSHSSGSFGQQQGDGWANWAKDASPAMSQSSPSTKKNNPFKKGDTPTSSTFSAGQCAFPAFPANSSHSAFFAEQPPLAPRQETPGQVQSTWGRPFSASGPHDSGSKSFTGAFAENTGARASTMRTSAEACASTVQSSAGTFAERAGSCASGARASAGSCAERAGDCASGMKERAANSSFAERAGACATTAHASAGACAERAGACAYSAKSTAAACAERSGERAGALAGAAKASNPFKQADHGTSVGSESHSSSLGGQQGMSAQEFMAGAQFAQDTGISTQNMLAGARAAQQAGITSKDVASGVQAAQQSGVTSAHIRDGAQLAKDSRVTTQHVLQGAKLAQDSGVTPQHLMQGAKMAHQAGLRPQHALQGAKMAQQAGVTPQHILSAGKAFSSMAK